MDIKLIGDRLLVRKEPEKQITESGLHLPQNSHKDMICEAVVLKLGQGRMNKDGSRIPFPVKPFDRILVPTYIGIDVEVDDEKLCIITTKEIICQIENATG